MAKRNQRAARDTRKCSWLGQLMLLSAALVNTPLCLAELASDELDTGKILAAEPDQRALLLYLGEFDPELDPVEISQMSDAQEKNTDAKAAANEPKK